MGEVSWFGVSREDLLRTADLLTDLVEPASEKFADSYFALTATQLRQIAEEL